MTTGAKGLGVGQLQGGVKTTPEDNTGEKPAKGQEGETEMSAGGIECTPEPFYFFEERHCLIALLDQRFDIDETVTNQ